MIDLNKSVSHVLVLLRYSLCALHHICVCYSALMWFFLISPLKLFRPQLFWRLFYMLANRLITVATWYTWSAGYSVLEMGDDISPCFHDRTLVLINHQCAGDIFILWNILESRPEITKDTFFIMNEEFKYTPYGFLCGIAKDFFIPIGKETREQGLVNLKLHLDKWYVPLQKKLIILFPEGGFLYKRRAKSEKYALQNNLPVLQNVCLPRLGAVRTILDVCNLCSKNPTIFNGSNEPTNEIKWILDVTIAYPKGVPLFFTTILGASRPSFNTTVLYRLYPANQVPSGSGEFVNWLYTIWQEKDKILGEFYETGTISTKDICSNSVRPRILTQNPYRQLIIHIFFFLSSILFYKICCLFVGASLLILLIILYIVFAALKMAKVI